MNSSDCFVISEAVGAVILLYKIIIFVCFYLSITSTGVSSRASRSLIYFWVSFMITLERSNTAIRFGMAIRAFRISATVHTRFREITGAMAATAMYRTRYGIRPFLPEKY